MEKMKYVERFREYWRSLIIEQKLANGASLGGAVVAYYPEIPISTFNHAADIRVPGHEINDLLNQISEFFITKKLPFTSFRIDPSNRPKSLTSILETRGFREEIRQSVMVFKGVLSEEKFQSEIQIEQISEGEVDLFNKLFIRIYDMPPEWKQGFDQLTLERLRKGVKYYLAYNEGRPVGTCGLFSSKKTGEIFAVGTLEEYRGRGIASSMVLFAIRDSIDLNNDLHTLRADVNDYPEKIYKKLGFKVDHTTSFYIKNTV